MIGFTASAGYDFMPNALKKLRQGLPEVDFGLSEMVTADQFDALDSRIIDVALLRPPIRRPGLETRMAMRESLAVALPADHFLTTRNVIQPRDLANERMVMYSPLEGRYFHDLVERLLEIAELTPRYVQHVSQVHTVLSLVRGGLGLGIVPDAARQLNFAGVVMRPINAPAECLVELYLAWRRGNRNPALRPTLDILLADVDNKDPDLGA
jgi:DNA-binding transcriptional LysR family regulator